MKKCFHFTQFMHQCVYIDHFNSISDVFILLAKILSVNYLVSLVLPKEKSGTSTKDLQVLHKLKKILSVFYL